MRYCIKHTKYHVGRECPDCRIVRLSASAQGRALLIGTEVDRLAELGIYITYRPDGTTAVAR